MSQLATLTTIHSGLALIARSASLALVALLVAMASFTSIVATPVAAQDATPVTADVVPDSALIYVAINTDLESSQHQKAAELLSRLGVDSLDSLVGDVSEAATGADVTAEFDMSTLLGGEAALAIFDFGDLSMVTGAMDGSIDAEPAMTEEPSIAAIISSPDPDAAYASAESAMEADASESGATITDETYEGVTIRVTPADETSDSSGTALARVGEFVVIGMTADDIELIIDTEAGRTTALANSDAYTSVLAELNAEWTVSGYVNGEAITGLIEDAPSELSALGSLDLAQMTAQSGFVVWADDPGFRIDSISLPPASESTDSSDSTVADVGDPQILEMIPSDAIIFSNGNNLGDTGVLDAIFLGLLSSLTGSVGTDSDPAATGSPEAIKSPEEIANEQFAQLEAILGFNLKTDFIDQMVGEWGFAVWGLESENLATMDPTNVKFIFMSDTATAVTVSDAVSKLSLLIQAGLSGQGSVTTRVIGDSQVSVLTIDDGSTTTPIEIEYGVVDGRFVISYNGAIDALVTDGGDALANSEPYQRAMEVLPAERTGSFFLDLTQIVPIVQAAVTSASSDSEFTDASEKCAEYESQEAAQSALDNDPATNWELDQDFDGEACEDHFAQEREIEATPVATSDQFKALTAFAAVSFERDGMSGVSAIFLITE